MARYMLFVRGGAEPPADATPEQLQQLIQPYIEWAGRLRAEGTLLGGDELANSGPVLRVHAGDIVVDGPYAETKEEIGGYFMIEAADEAEAITISRGCPTLTRGGVVEIRAVIEH